MPLAIAALRCSPSPASALAWRLKHSPSSDPHHGIPATALKSRRAQPRSASRCGTWASARSTCSPACSRRCPSRCGRCSSPACSARLPGRAAVACARDGVRLHAGRHRRIPLHRRPKLEQPADAHRLEAGRARGCCGSPGACWCSRRSPGRGRGQRRVSARCGGLPRHAVREGAATGATTSSSACSRLMAVAVGLRAPVAAGRRRAHRPGLGIQVALDVVLFIVAVMAGRVIPMFTNNGVPGRRRDPQAASSRRLALGLGARAACHRRRRAQRAAARRSWPLVACAAHAWRWALWQPWKTGACRWSGCCTWPTCWVPVHLGLRASGRAGSGRAVRGHACTDGGRRRRTHHRHDDAHRARPHGSPAAGRPLRCRLLRARAPGRAGAGRCCRSSRRRRPSMRCWSPRRSGQPGSACTPCATGRCCPRPRLDGRPG